MLEDGDSIDDQKENCNLSAQTMIKLRAAVASGDYEDEIVPILDDYKGTPGVGEGVVRRASLLFEKHQ